MLFVAPPERRNASRELPRYSCIHGGLRPPLNLHGHSYIMTYHSPYDTNASRYSSKKELARRLREFEFHYFVTLATNHSSLSEHAMRHRLKKWDAKMNRFLIGSKWVERPDERMVWFAFLEKAHVNPHWHLIVQLDSPQSSGVAHRQSGFEIRCKTTWKRLIPAGDADVRVFDSPGVIDYITKELWSAESFSNFIVWSEFRNR